MTKKVLLVGNHSCSNRGDAAITRGLIQHIREEHPGWEQTIVSRSPKGAEVILEENVEQDTTRVSKKSEVHSLGQLFSRAVRRFVNLDPVVIYMMVAYRIPSARRFLPDKIKNMINMMSNYDTVIQVGGSFFVDLYGMSQYRLLMCSLLAGRPAYLIGHSLGPFSSGRLYGPVAGWILNRMSGIVLRDKDSELLLAERFPGLNYTLGADTAWLVPPTYSHKKDKAVAVTVRELKPFDSRLGISQEEYEAWIAKLCEILIDKGYEIRFYSTCTSFDGYHKDDRLVARSVKKQVVEEKQKAIYICEEELTDLELGLRFSQCSFTVGTRLHSAIISMNFGTPAVAIAYEHKALGMYRDMGLQKYAINLSDYHKVDLDSFFEQYIEDINNDYSIYSAPIEEQRRLAKRSVILETVDKSSAQVSLKNA